MGAWAGRAVLSAGLVANAVLVHHPVLLAAAQAAAAVGVLCDWGGAATLAVAALLLVPAPFVEGRRLLSGVPLACPCMRASGWRGGWAVLGAAADVGVIGLAAWLARQRSARPARPSGAATES